VPTPVQSRSAPLWVACTSNREAITIGARTGSAEQCPLPLSIHREARQGATTTIDLQRGMSDDRARRQSNTSRCRDGFLRASREMELFGAPAAARTACASSLWAGPSLYLRRAQARPHEMGRISKRRATRLPPDGADHGSARRTSCARIAPFRGVRRRPTVNPAGRPQSDKAMLRSDGNVREVLMPEFKAREIEDEQKKQEQSRPLSRRRMARKNADCARRDEGLRST